MQDVVPVRGIRTAHVIVLCLASFVASCSDGKELECPRKTVLLSHQVPGDFHSDCVGAQRSLANLQDDFDNYSWDSFIALNWPVRKNGEPDVSKIIGDTENGDNATVWEAWKPMHEVFLDGGANPPKWGTAPFVPEYWTKSHANVAQCVNGAPWSEKEREAVEDSDRKFISKIAKGHSWFADEQPFNSGPLIDQDGKYARFEIVINRDMFEYIVDQELYSAEGQEMFGQKNVVFPCGEFKEGERDEDGRPITEKVGAVVVKAAWKVLNDKEIASRRFHMRDALLATPADKHSTGAATECLQHAKIGLVGLHIVHKSKDVPQWNWSTFEHVDNNPEAGQVDPQRSYSFFSQSAQHAPPINTAPSRPWNPLIDQEPPERRSQIVRMIPLTAEVRAINKRYQEALRKANADSVWQYYQLISTQWPTRPSRPAPNTPNTCDVQEMSPADVLGGPAPVFLGNSTLESYIQGTVPNTSSSCMDCHANAVTHAGRFADFTYILERAKRQKAAGAHQP